MVHSPGGGEVWVGGVGGGAYTPGLPPQGKMILPSPGHISLVTEISRGDDSSVLREERCLDEGRCCRLGVQCAAHIPNCAADVVKAADREVGELDVGLDGDHSHLHAH